MEVFSVLSTMKYFRNLFFILFFSNVICSVLHAEEQLITDVYTHDNDTSFRYSYIYNQGQMRVEMKYYQDGVNWLPLSQTEWVFKNNLCATHIEQTYKNSGWETTYQIAYTYDGEKISSETHSIFVSSIATPIRRVDYSYSQSLPDRKTVYSLSGMQETMIEQSDYTYTESNRLQSITQTLFNAGAATHQYIFKHTYNSRNQTDSILLQERTLPDEAKNSELITYNYISGSDLVRFQRNQRWNPATKEWINTQKLHCEYIGDRLVRETYQKWDIQFWRNELCYDYSYSSEGLLSAKTMSKSIYQQWRSIISIDYSYLPEPGECHIEAKYDFWGGVMGEYVSTYIPFLFNGEMVQKKAKTIDFAYQPPGTTTNDMAIAITIYPNPSDGIFYFDTQQHNVLSWTVCDVDGRVLKSQMQTYYSGIIDITDLKKGIYILSAITDKGVVSQKLVKNK